MNDWRWIEKSPMLDGSGIVDVKGQRFRVVVQDLVSTKQRVAFSEGAEVARATTFPRLLRKLAISAKADKGQKDG